MAERDVAWFFGLLPPCDKLRLLLIFGPIVRRNGQCERLFDFLLSTAPRHGFNLVQDVCLRLLEHRQ